MYASRSHADQEPEPEPYASASAPPPDKLEHAGEYGGGFGGGRGAGSGQMSLINAVQGIDIRELGLKGGSGGATIDWPQICVVGGQSAGKSTLLSAVVSAKLNTPLKFLPEGTDMVTRCPICVQMQSPNGQFNHIAKVFTDNGEADPGQQNEIECEGGADPSPEELAAWGTKIQLKISAVQDIIEPTGRNVTSKKIIVRLTGPKMINLSLVDLPGLRAIDDARSPGLKDRLGDLVKQTIRSPNCVILSVGEAGVDPATWVGTGLAKEVDTHETRTIGVVTKVDLMFLVGNATSKANRAQVQRIIQDPDGDIDWYAAYNPPDGDVEHLPPDLAEQIADTFGPRYAGNNNIADGLSEKLMGHLQDQLPRLFRQFAAREQELRRELKMAFRPTWTMVEQLILTYGRFVQEYAQGDKPADARGIGYMEFFDREDNFPTELTSILEEFEEKNKPVRIYQARGAGGQGGGKSILHNSTAEVLKEADGYRKNLAEIKKKGKKKAKEHEASDEDVAYNLADTLNGKLKGLTKEVSACMDEKVKPLCSDFYAAVSQVTFEYAAENDQADTWTGCVSQYGNLWRMIQVGNQRILDQNTEAVKKHVNNEQTAQTTAEDVDEKFMEFPEVVAALTRVCEFHIEKRVVEPLPEPEPEPEPHAVGFASPAPAPAPLARQRSVRRPPQMKCYKQKPNMGTWPERYIRMCTTEYPRGMMVHTNLGDMKPRSTSILDLTGCDVQDREMEKFTFSADLYKLGIYKRGMEPEEQVNFSFDTAAERTEVATVCRNLAAGRDWNESAEQARAKQQEAQQAAADAVAEQQRAAAAAQQKLIDDALQAQQDQQDAAAADAAEDVAAAPARAPVIHVAPIAELLERLGPATRENPEGEIANRGEILALRGEYDGDHEKYHRGKLLEICSPVFADFFKQVRSRPTGQRLERLQDRMEDEIRAEAFRLWSLNYVLTNLAQVVAVVEKELNERFLDTKGARAPFSAVSIFTSVKLSELIQKATDPEQPEKKTPDFLLSIHDGVRDRETKQGYLHTLEDILQRFKEHDYVL